MTWSERFNRLVSGKNPDRGNWMSVLFTKNPILAVLMLNTMEHCSRDNEIRCGNRIPVLWYQHQWELDWKITNNAEVPKVNKDDWDGKYGVHSSASLVQEEVVVRGTLLAYMAWHCVKVANILTWYLAYLSLDQDMIARAPLQLTQCQTPEDSGLARHEECW